MILSPKIHTQIQSLEQLISTRSIAADVQLRVVAGLALLRKVTKHVESLTDTDYVQWAVIREHLLSIREEEQGRSHLGFLFGYLPKILYSERPLLVLLREFWNLNTRVRIQLLEVIEALDWSNSSNDASQLLSGLLGDFTLRQPKFAQYGTPYPVTQLMAELAAPQPGETIYDPCFGSANLLLSCLGFARQSQSSLKVELLGAEINEQAFALGFARLYLTSADFLVKCDDTLSHPVSAYSSAQKADVIVAALPFGLRVNAEHYRGNFPLSTSDGAALFLQHIMASLRPGGRAVVCVSESFLFNGAVVEQVRARISQEFDLEGVIDLPSGTFQPYANVSASLLIFRHERPSGSVRFMEAPTLKGTVGRLSRDSEAVAPQEVASQFRKAHADRVWTVSNAELQQNDFSLSGRRYRQLQDEIAGVPMIPLSEVSEIWRGINYRSQDVADAQETRAGQGRVGLIRSSEIEAGRFMQVLPPQRFVESSFIGKHRERLLRAGDILVSSIGSKAKIGIVGPEAAGALASHNLFVIRVGQNLAPDYLLAVLRSDRFSLWLETHIVGSTIKRISYRDLKDFQVPLPELAMQMEVARRFTATQEDVDILLRENSDVKEFLWPALHSLSQKMRLADFEAETSDQAVHFLARWSRDFLPIRESVVSNTLSLSDSVNIPWVNALVPAIGTWLELESIPPGTTRLWMLECAMRHLQGAQRTLDRPESLPDADKVYTLESLSKLNRIASADLFEMVSVEISVEPIGAENERSEALSLRVTNRSPLALRDFSVTLPDFDWQKKTKFLAESGAQEFSLSLSPHIVKGLDEVNVLWKAKRLDGAIVRGEELLSLGAINSRFASEEFAELGSNPYVTGKPIPGNRPEIMFGREEVLSEVRSQLSQSESANVFFFIGNRRAGKTTLLERLHSAPPEDWILAFTSLQKAEGQNVEALPDNREIFRLWSLAIVQELLNQGITIWPPLSDFIAPPEEERGRLKRIRMVREQLNVAFKNSEEPFELFEEYLRAALSAIAPRRLLLMVDEFDKLAQSIGKGYASKSVPENLRYLLQSYPDFTAIIAGSHRLHELSGGYWSPLFGLGVKKDISSLSQEASQELITQPVAGRIRFTDEARDEIVSLCARHAYLIQGFCSQIFNCVERTDDRVVTSQVVKEIADEIVVNHPFFGGLWDDAESERRRLLMLICASFADAAEDVTLQFLLDQLRNMQVRVPRQKDVSDDLSFLRQLGVLRLEKGVYTLAIPLLLRWLQTQQDPNRQREKAEEEANALT